jgi:hypothetical protein
MNKMTKYRRVLRVPLLVLILVAFVLPGPGAQATEVAPAVETHAALAGPDSAPNPPEIFIGRQGSAIQLDWDHSDAPTVKYEVWRSQSPYLTAAAPAIRIGTYYFSQGVYGVGTPFSYVDNGSCGYFIAGGQNITCQTQNPSVTVVGDVLHNYFWIVSAGNANSEFAHLNTVGEFDFTLVRGG